MARRRKLEDFEGSWILRRRIIGRDGPAGIFNGGAIWKADMGGLLYTEVGLLQMTGKPPRRMERRYRWGADLSIFFEDGKFFHRVPPEGGGGKHWVGEELYSVQYRFDTWPVFESVWRVKGPISDYALISRYEFSEGPAY